MPTEVHQSEISERARSGSHVSWFIWVVPTLLILYVLSVGPAVKFYQGNHPPELINLMYKPIEMVVEHSSAADKFLDWYLHDVWRCRWEG